MKYCPNCGSGVADDATFCPTCGATFVAQQAPAYNAPNPGYNNAPNYGYAPAPVAAKPARPAVDPTDHTKEFDAQDISDNKVICMLIYLAGYIGIFVALLMANTSKYVSFHIRQALKIEVVSLLFTLVSSLASILIGLIALIPILGWIIAAVYALAVLAVPVVLFIIKIMCFFQICKGQAKEPALLNKLPFLK